MKISSIAPVGEAAPIRADFSAMSAHTSAWSECRSPENFIDSVTWDIRFARPAAYCVRGALLNACDRARQRPASTHETGIVSFEAAGTRIERVTTRFCLAPAR